MVVHGRGPASHLTGFAPKTARKVFISDPGSSPKIRRKVMPATTMQTRAGRKSAERKKPLAGISREFSIAASAIGTGIRIAQVMTI